MGGLHLFTPDGAAIQGATAAGTFVALLVRRLDWRAMLSWFLVGQISSFYLVAPILMAVMWDLAYSRAVGFGFGAFGMLLWSAAFVLSQRLSDDPVGTLEHVWRTFRGQGGSER